MITASPKSHALKIAIYRTSSIGDVVLATACLDLLSSLPLPVEVTWLGRGAPLQMIAQAWPNVSAIEISRATSSGSLGDILKALKDCHALVDLQSNLRSQWLGRQLRMIHGVPYFAAPKAQIARSRMILEARLRGRRRPLAQDVVLAKPSQFHAMVDTLKRALQKVSPSARGEAFDRLSYRPRLPIPDHIDPPWRKELRLGCWLGVAPGAAHPTKEAPTRLLAEIIQEVGAAIRRSQGLLQKPASPLGLVLFGNAKDRETSRQLVDQIEWNGPVLNLAGRLTLWESAIALSETNCLLSNDSSLAHIAEAVDTPTVVIFGPTVEAFGFGPRMTESKSFSALLGCRPCSKHGKIPCRYGDKLCFNALSSQTMAKSIERILWPLPLVTAVAPGLAVAIHSEAEP